METMLTLNERDPNTVDLFSGITDQEATAMACIISSDVQRDFFDPRREQGVCMSEVPTPLKAV